MFFDEKGDLNVHAVIDIRTLSPQARDERVAAAQKAIGAVFGEPFLAQRGRAIDTREELSRSPDIRLVQGRYTIGQLAEWRSVAVGLLELRGVVLVDLDEVRNRLRIGIESTELRERIEAESQKRGIPRDAVDIEVVRPIRFHASLRSSFRPMPGGVQVEADTGLFSYKHCTVGFNAIREGVGGFVTNSHCTTDLGGSEGTDFHQPDDPLLTEGNKVGDEIVDPLYFTAGPCPSGRRCRLSDSAFVGYTIARGQDIVRTTGWNNASLEVNPSIPTLPIVSEATTWVIGNELDKIGRTTGWTYGVVTATCQDINVVDTDITLLCQDTVTRRMAQTQTMSGHGDSGAPVFRWRGVVVELAGILWGGTDDGTSFSFSPLDQVEAELGALTTFAFPTPSPSRPRFCGVGQRCCRWTSDPPGKPFCLICVPNAAACP
jgi:hypothetical protein